MLSVASMSPRWRFSDVTDPVGGSWEQSGLTPTLWMHREVTAEGRERQRKVRPTRLTLRRTSGRSSLECLAKNHIDVPCGRSFKLGYAFEAGLLVHDAAFYLRGGGGKPRCQMVPLSN
jgi:hypothetical protein